MLMTPVFEPTEKYVIRGERIYILIVHRPSLNKIKFSLIITQHFPEYKFTGSREGIMKRVLQKYVKPSKGH